MWIALLCAQNIARIQILFEFKFIKKQYLHFGNRFFIHTFYFLLQLSKKKYNVEINDDVWYLQSLPVN